MVTVLLLLSLALLTSALLLRWLLQRRRKLHDDKACSQPSEQEKAWLRRLAVSDADVQRIRARPQRLNTGRASPEWLHFRRHRLTASRFCKAAAAVSPDVGKGDAQLSRQQLLEEMLTLPEARGSPRRFGIAQEAKARQSYVGYRTRGRDVATQAAFRVEETGLCVWQGEPWLAASPDGIVFDGDDVGALEIKCCQDASRMYSIDPIAEEYFDQIQGEMAILSAVLGRAVAWCDFFVWSPGRRLCRRVPFNAEYFHGILLPRLREFYFGSYVPVALRMPVGASGAQVQQGVRRVAKEQLLRNRKKS